MAAVLIIAILIALGLRYKVFSKLAILALVVVVIRKVLK